jgi:hypothetical protein
MRVPLEEPHELRHAPECLLSLDANLLHHAEEAPFFFPPPVDPYDIVLHARLPD